MSDLKQPGSLAESLGEFAAALHPGHFDLQQAAALNAKYDLELRQAAEAVGLIPKTQDSFGKGPGN